ncbi:2-amino-4-hydroxy-6-hydroxymethyldihydropteridine diphosphokinase [Aeoliella mucimassa]|uniref:2-amino-4-hydroxy-6-hydroxymethyldihydropteridine pyrophosphokinase n=1 Tax=Aeoliella mucimassa TaxID=2527972 RepID=A0A518AHR1_9BACT|nr:2-amino-4-hydroxy-6-hydroxymethyldihydropteridine diphosphokinase [Aeoliella mucimassa]QDU54260.1 2-amino-4-hydroxy-6-hydroxymethyldihydropteridine pyrophosphokinase [Aeoliella mucimassa]
MVHSLLALGSNLGDSQATVENALTAIDDLPHTSLVRRSELHATSAVGGPTGQPMFVNAAAVVETTLEPAALLAALHGIEQQFGRERMVRWASRTLDIDLLLVDQQQLVSETLVLPHPRMSFRPFVLQPAVEIAGDWVHPGLQTTLSDLLTTLITADGGLSIYGGSSDARQYHAEQIAKEFSAMRIQNDGRDALRLVLGESREPLPTPRLAIELVVRRGATRPGVPTLSVMADARSEVLFDTIAAVELAWPELCRSEVRADRA